MILLWIGVLVSVVIRIRSALVAREDLFRTLLAPILAGAASGGLAGMFLGLGRPYGGHLGLAFIAWGAIAGLAGSFFVRSRQ